MSGSGGLLNGNPRGLFGSSMLAPQPAPTAPLMSPQPQQQPQQMQPPPMPQGLGMPAPGALPAGTVRNYHRYTGGDPKARTSWEPLSGDAFLAELSKTSPAYAARIKAMGDGRLPIPNGLGSSSAPDAVMMKNALAMYDPAGMDSIVNGNRAATRKNFSANGEAMQNIRNLNQAIGHLGRLVENIPNVAGHQIPLIGGAVNWAQNAIADASGDPGITAFGTDRTALSNELASVFKGKGASSENEVNKFYEQLSPDGSTPQKQANVRELIGLLDSRLQTIADQYNQGMGSAVAPMHFLTLESQKTWARLKNLGQQNASGPVQIRSAADYAKLPSGTSYIDPEGQRRTKQ